MNYNEQFIFNAFNNIIINTKQQYYLYLHTTSRYEQNL